MIGSIFNEILTDPAGFFCGGETQFQFGLGMTGGIAWPGFGGFVGSSASIGVTSDGVIFLQGQANYGTGRGVYFPATGGAQVGVSFQKPVRAFTITTSEGYVIEINVSPGPGGSFQYSEDGVQFAGPVLGHIYGGGIGAGVMDNGRYKAVTVALGQLESMAMACRHLK